MPVSDTPSTRVSVPLGLLVLIVGVAVAIAILWLSPIKFQIDQASKLLTAVYVFAIGMLASLIVTKNGARWPKPSELKVKVPAIALGLALSAFASFWLQQVQQYEMLSERLVKACEAQEGDFGPAFVKAQALAMRTVGEIDQLRLVKIKRPDKDEPCGSSIK